MTSNGLLLIAAAIQAYSLVLFARIVVSWVNLDRSNKFIQVLHQLTEPVLEPVRRMLPRTGMVDIAPLVVCLVLNILQPLVLSLGTDSF